MALLHTHNDLYKYNGILMQTGSRTLKLSVHCWQIPTRLQNMDNFSGCQQNHNKKNRCLHEPRHQPLKGSLRIGLGAADRGDRSGSSNSFQIVPGLTLRVLVKNISELAGYGWLTMGIKNNNYIQV